MSFVDQIMDKLAKGKIVVRAPWSSTDVFWLDNGIHLRNRFINLITARFREGGYQEVQLPSIIPAELLGKEEDHYRDIRRLSFRLDSPQTSFLRATSECQFSALAGSGDLGKYPIKAFQVCSVFRRERAHSQIPILRAVEIEPFVEAMTYTSSSAREVRKEILIYASIFHDLCVPVAMVLRPSWDTFPEARRTFAFDLVLPTLGSIQLASVHDLGDSFPKAFGLRLKDGRHALHSSSGISGRALLSSILLHAHGGNILLPSKLCQTTVSIQCAIPSMVRDHLSQTFGASNHKQPIGFVAPVTIEARKSSTVRLRTAFGEVISAPLARCVDQCATLAGAHDSKLLQRAQARTRIRGSDDDLLSEIRWCGNLACLLPSASAKYGQEFLGTTPAPTELQSCENCFRPARFNARFARVV